MQRLTGWPGFLAIWAGQGISRLGTGMYAFGIGVFVYERTQSATLFGLILFFELLPGVLIAPYAGIVADRVNRRTIMLFGNAGMIGGSLVVLLATVNDQVNVWVLYPAMVVTSVAAAFHVAAYDSSIVLLMPESRWNRANGLAQLSEGIASVSAPLVAGTLLAVLHIWGLIALDITSYAVAILALLVLRMPDLASVVTQRSVAPAPQSGTAPRQGDPASGDPVAGEPALAASQPEPASPPAPAQQPKPRLRDDLRVGWRFLGASGGLPILLTLTSMLNFFVNIAVVGATPLILSFAGAATFGVVAAAGGAGMVAGGLVMVAWKGPARRVPLLLTGLCGTGVFIGLYGVRPSPALVAVAQFGFFFCLPIVNAMGAGIWQRRVPAELQGRVFAVRRMLVTIMVPIAILLAGPLIDNVFKPLLDGGLADVFAPVVGTGPSRGIGLLFVLLGVAMLGTSLIAASNPRLRALEETDPAVPPVPQPEPSGAVGGA